MTLESLADELRVMLTESFGGAMTHRSSSSRSSFKHRTTPHVQHLSPDAFKQKWGRCPVGFNSHPETGRCTPIDQIKPVAGAVAVHRFEPAATVKQVPVGPATEPAATVKQVDLPKAAVAPKAEPEDTPEEKKEHGLLKKALHGVWHAISDPFKKAWKLATDKKYRTEVKDFVVKAVKKEGSQTKSMAGTFKRVLQGEKVSREEKVAAMNQLADLVKVAAVGGLAAHMAGGGIAKFLATMASPVDEVVGIAVDGPMRKITKKIFGHAHGILPSSFYESIMLSEAYKEGDEHKLIEKLVDAMLDEMGKTDLADEDILRALVKKGLTTKKKSLIAKVLAVFSKNEVLIADLRASVLG